MHFKKEGFYNIELLHIHIPLWVFQPLIISLSLASLHLPCHLWVNKDTGPVAPAERDCGLCVVSYLHHWHRLRLSFLSTYLITPMCRLFLMLPLLTHLHPASVQKKSLWLTLRALLQLALLFLYCAVWCYHPPSPVLTLSLLLLSHCVALREQSLCGPAAAIV